MCRISVDVDEAALRVANPNFNNIAAIQLWVQQLVNLGVHNMVNDDTETVDLETAREVLLATVRDEYAKP